MIHFAMTDRAIAKELAKRIKHAYPVAAHCSISVIPPAPDVLIALDCGDNFTMLNISLRSYCVRIMRHGQHPDRHGIKQPRLNKDLSQRSVAESAGISITAVQGVENCESTIMTLIKVLRVFGSLDSLENFLPEITVSPIALAKLEGKKQKKASGKR